MRAQKTLRIVFPAVMAVIVLILYLTYQSWVDARLMMTSVLGALAGGAIFQWLFGFTSAWPSGSAISPASAWP